MQSLYSYLTFILTIIIQSQYTNPMVVLCIHYLLKYAFKYFLSLQSIQVDTFNPLKNVKFHAFSQAHFCFKVCFPGTKSLCGGLHASTPGPKVSISRYSEEPCWDSMGVLGLSSRMSRDTKTKQETFLMETGGRKESVNTHQMQGERNGTG